VDDLVSHIDRRAIFFERALDDLDCTHDTRAKPARLRKIYFHGTPVTQVAPLSVCVSVRLEYLQYPHQPPLKMEAERFVSKNDRLEKADRNTLCPERSD
jgi:hypothetical protein